MNLDLIKSSTSVRKKLFKVKSQKDNGLVLTVRALSDKKRTRLVLGCFHEDEYILAVATNGSIVYIIDFFNGKYWRLPELESCSVIKFSEWNSNELLVGQCDGVIKIVDIETGICSSKLFGHNNPVNSVSFARKYLLLTASYNEAIVWDLRDNSKRQVLHIQKECAIKLVKFIPVTWHILACFHDDVIQIWRQQTYETLKQFEPSNWNNYSVKCLAFTRNGKIMVVGGYLPNLAIFSLNNWKLLKLVTLPDEIQTVRSLQFVAQNFDGGCNRFLAVLSGRGILYFYDVEDNVVKTNLRSSCEVNRFECSQNGNFIWCLLCSGEIEVYNLNHIISTPNCVAIEKAQTNEKRKMVLRKLAQGEKGKHEQQIEGIISIDKLKVLLREYGRYPDSYRSNIWEKVLKLPNKIQQYNTIINHVTTVSFNDLYEKFPLQNKNLIKSLRILLTNIVTWCPFFAHVQYLPFFVFPFVKVFHKKPVACFEAVCTVLINWCQHWFEYYPLHPMNVLSMIENIILEHDPELLHYFNYFNVPTYIYAWTLLQSAFSEVLTCEEWLELWDHVLTNEPSFLLCSVVAYNIVQRKTIMAFNSRDNLLKFYQSQNPVDIKKLISKSYYILENTTDGVHPRQYLKAFTEMKTGLYPKYTDYNKTIIECEEKSMRNFENDLEYIKSQEQNMHSEKMVGIKDSRDFHVKAEEERRQLAIEKFCVEKLKRYQEGINQQYERLECMRKNLLEEEKEVLDSTKQRIENHQKAKKHSVLNLLMDNLDVTELMNKKDISRVETELLEQYLKLLRHRYKVEKMFNESEVEGSIVDFCKTVAEGQQKLKDEIEKVKKTYKSPRDLKKLNVATSIRMIESLIETIQDELSTSETVSGPKNVKANIKAWALHNETKELESEVTKLLRLFLKQKTAQTNVNASSGPSINSNDCRGVK